MNIVPPIGEGSERKGELRKGGENFDQARREGGGIRTGGGGQIHHYAHLSFWKHLILLLFFRRSSAFPRKMLFILRTFALLSPRLVLSKASLS